MSEQAWLAVLRAVVQKEVENAPTQHRSWTPQCPPLPRFTAADPAWTQEEQAHINSNCSYCRNAMAIRQKLLLEEWWKRCWRWLYRLTCTGVATTAGVLIVSIILLLWFVPPNSRIAAVTLFLANAKSSAVTILNPADAPATYKVSLPDVTYKLECRVQTSRAQGVLYQISRDKVTHLGSFERGDDGFVTASSEVQFGEQSGRELFVIVLLDKRGNADHLVQSLGGFLSEEDRERLVEAAGQPDVAAKVREIISSALKEAGLTDTPVEVLVVATVVHSES